MENDDDMRRLMEQLMPSFYSRFAKNLMNVSKDSFVPCGCITEDLFEYINIILSIKQVLTSERWENFVAINRLKIVSSYESYVEYIMFACITEIASSDDIFDSLLSACALVIAFGIETLEKTSVNFCELSVDIFMVFYKSALKDRFSRHGSFERFREYLRHEYIKWENFFMDDPEDSNLPITRKVCLMENSSDIMEKEIEKTLKQPETIPYNDIRNSLCHSWAKEVLLITKVKLSTLPSSDYLNADRNKKLLTLEKTKKRNSGFLKPEKTTAASKSETTPTTSNPETTPTASNPGTMILASKHKTNKAFLSQCSNSVANFQASTVFENTAWYDNIVKDVINYNVAKSRSLTKNCKRVQKTEEILEHLNDTIKSLAEVLENHDKKVF